MLLDSWIRFLKPRLHRGPRPHRSRAQKYQPLRTRCLERSYEVLEDRALLTAIFSWEMAPRYGLDANDDGRIDIPNTFDYVDPAFFDFEVSFNGTGSSVTREGSASTTPVKYAYHITGGPSNVDIVETVDDGLLRSKLPDAGTYQVELTVEDAQGFTNTTGRVSIEVKDILIVAMGDSYGSGEGNPDIRQDGWQMDFTIGPQFPAVNLENPSRYKPPAERSPGPAQWADANDAFPHLEDEHKASHRSAFAAASQMAMALERLDPHSSVTFVFVSQSGATIREGALEPYAGVQPPYKDFLMDPQIDQIRDIVGDRQIDLLTVNLGGNDIGFARVVQSLLLPTRKDVSLDVPEVTTRESRFKFLEDAVQFGDADSWENVNDTLVAGDFFGVRLLGVETEQLSGLSGLQVDYDDLARSIDALPNPPRQVYITEYPDPSQFLAVDNSATVYETCGPLGVDEEELQWVREHLIAPLNQEIRNAVSRQNLRPNGKSDWTYVSGIVEAFANHGFCADNPYDKPHPDGRMYRSDLDAVLNTVTWMRGLGHSFEFQGNKSGFVHPNEFGHEGIMQKMLGRAVLDLFGPDISATIDPARFSGFHEYTVDAEHGDVLDILVNGLDFDALAFVFGPGQLPTKVSDVFEGSFLFPVVDGVRTQFRVTTPGPYTITVQGNDPGTYQLHVDVRDDIITDQENAVIMDTVDAFGDVFLNLDDLDLSPEEGGEEGTRAKASADISPSVGDPLPLINQSLVDVVGSKEILQQHLVNPLEELFVGQDVTTVSDVEEFLKGISVTGGDLIVQVAPDSVAGGFFTSDDAEELRFDLVLEALRTVQVPIDLGASAAEVGLEFDASATVDFTASLGFDFSFGLHLDPDLTPAEAAFMRVNGMTMGGVVATEDLDLVGRLGMLGVGVEDGSVNLDVDLNVNFALPELSLSDLTGIPVGELVTIDTPTAMLNVDLPFTATLGGQTLVDPNNPPRITVTDDDLFSGPPPEPVPSGFDELLNFKHMNPYLVLALLKQLRASLDGLRDASLANTEIPLTRDKTLADVIDVGATFGDRVLTELEDDEGNPTFSTVQELLDKIAAAAGADYDPETHELTFDLAYTHAFDSLEADIGFDAALGSLTEISTSSTVSLVPELAFAATVGFDLSALEEDTTPNDPTDNDTPAHHVFLRDTSLTGSVALAADDIDATARFAFLGVEIIDGSVGLTAETTLELLDPGTVADDGRVDLPELLTGLGSIGTLVAFPPPITVGIDPNKPLVLPVRMNPNLLGADHPADPRITIQWPDLLDPQSFDAQFNADMQELLDFGSLSFTQIIDALLSAAEFLTRLEEFSFLNQDLPLVNRSVSDFVAYARAFTDRIRDVEENPAAALDEVEEKLEQSLGIPPDLLDFSLDIGPESRAVRIEVTFEPPRLDEETAINLDLEDLVSQLPANHPARTALEGVTSIIDVSGEAKLAASAGATLELSLGVDVTEPLNPRPFLYSTTGLQLDAALSGTDINFRAAAGPLGIFIQDGQAVLDADGDPATNEPALFTVTLVDDDNDGRVYFSELLEEPLTDNVAVDLTGQVDAALPVYFPTKAVEDRVAPDFALSITDLKDIPGTISLEAPNLAMAIQDYLQDFSLLDNLGVIVSGLDFLLEKLQEGLTSQVFSTNFPVVGEQLQDGAQFIGDLRSDFVTPLAERLEEEPALNVVQTELFNLLGPGELGILGDTQGDGDADGDGHVADPSDVVVTQIENADGKVVDVRFNVLLQQNAKPLDVPIEFDAGIHGLGLEVDGNVQVELGYDLLLGFGVSEEEGFYFDTSAGSELDVALKATIPDLVASGELAFLDLMATDEDADANPDNDGEDADGDGVLPTSFVGSFTVNFMDPVDDPLTTSDDSKLTFDDLTGGVAFSDIVDARFSGDADVNLNLTAGFGDDGKFPSIHSDFNLDWGFEAVVTGPDAGFLGEKPAIMFNDVELDVGSFFSKFAAPYLEPVRQILKPVAPVLDLLTEPLAGLSDLEPAVKVLDADRDGAVTLIDLVEIFSADAEIADFVSAVLQTAEIVDLVADIIDRIEQEGDSLIIPLGSFMVMRDLRDPDADPKMEDLLTSATDPEKELEKKADEMGEDSSAKMAAEFVSEIGTVPGAGLQFPILTNPASAFGLLMGEDVPLFTFDMPRLQAHFAVSLFFPILPPLGASFTGSLGAAADFAFGYDTAGLRAYSESKQLDDLLDGFFVSDTANPDGSGGNDVAEVTLRGSIEAAAELNVAVASASVGGGVFATIGLNLNDPNDDGKVRLQELLANIQQSPLCVFDAEGQLTAGLNAKLKVLGITHTFNIASVPIPGANFEAGCVAQPDEGPRLATLDGGTLRLNMGPRSDQRNIDDKTDGDETFAVALGEEGQIIVEAFSLTQEFLGVDRIEAVGGLGNDTIVIGSGTTVPVELWGDFNSDSTEGGSDTLVAGGGAAVLRGGVGDDQLQGGVADDKIFGGPGNDTLVGRGGNDILRGESGGDNLQGGVGTDALFGGDDNDLLGGGAGDDELQGDAGDDALTGGDGDDLLQAGDGNDVLDGGDGSDQLEGGVGSDDLRGGSGNDVLLAGAGFDTLDGGAGDDLLEGGSFADTLTGGEGNDTLRGGDAADEMFGGPGDDILEGGSGNDRIDAGVGNDTVDGGLGDDVLLGGIGTETIFGGEGADVIFAGTSESGGGASEDSHVLYGDMPGSAQTDGDDRIYGDVGDDIIFAGGGNDHVFGLAGDDELRGEAGNDQLNAGAGVDLVLGAGGDDLLYGGLGADVLDAGSGNDQAYGQAGDDRLIGGEGNDVLSGGDGRDQLWGGAAAFVGSGLAADGVSPAIVAGISLDGQAGDGRDTLRGGAGLDWLFGGGDADDLDGGVERDYVDGGADNDLVRGGPDDDVLRGGANDDILHGGAGIDLVYGDAGADELFGDAGDTDGNQQGQQLFGGPGSDTLYAYAETSDAASEQGEIGDELFGGPDNDKLYGNLRRELLIGGGGNDFLHGDFLAGPYYAQNRVASTTGGGDELRGDLGEDELLGGGGDDLLWGGGDSDRLEGQDGDDTLLGGSGIDVLVVDVDAAYELPQNDHFDGHFGNSPESIGDDDNATDILLIEGTSGPDEIIVSETEAGLLHVAYNDRAEPMIVNWRDDDADQTPLVEQFRITGFAGDDRIGFGDTPRSLDVDALDVRSRDFVAVIDGGPGDDALTGSPARDRLDGGSGSDVLFGLAGDDRLWGDGGSGAADDHDVVFAGAGNDDLLGGQGTNELYAWSGDPLAGGQFGVFVDPQNSQDDTRHDNDGGRTYILEDTGLNRMLGGPNDDSLYGGTGLDFLFGNGGDDVLVRSDGTPFEDLDGGLAGDEWKTYARQTGKVWYVGGSNESDIITVDFVTEEGSLQERHLVTRLTENDGHFSFAVDLHLDFDATDEAGQRMWDPVDAAFAPLGENADRVEEDFLAIIVDALAGDDEITVGPTVLKSVWVDAGSGDDRVEIRSGNPILADVAERHDQDGDGQTTRNDDLNEAFALANVTQSTIFRGLTLDSPNDEDWFQVSLDVSPQAGDFLSVASLSTDDGLRVELVTTAGDTIAQATQPDRLDLGGLNLPASEFLLHVSGDKRPTIYELEFFLLSTPDLAEENDTSTSAYSVGEIKDQRRIGGLSLHTEDDVDWFRLPLTYGEPARLVASSEPPVDGILTGTAMLTLSVGGGQPVEVPIAPTDNKSVLDLLDDVNAALADTELDDAIVAGLEGRRLTLSVATAGSDETLSVVGANEIAVSELGFGVGMVALPQASLTIEPLDDGLELAAQVYADPGAEPVRQAQAAPGATSSTIDLAGLTTGEYFLRVNSVSGQPGRYEVQPAIGTVGFESLELADRTLVDLDTGVAIVRRDVILGGEGKDVLSGGPGEDWIFGGAGNDVLAGGLDGQLSDLLFGQKGDDTFQLVPDRLPLVGGGRRSLGEAEETVIPTLTDRLDGGEGKDRVLFLGGDLDSFGRSVPDRVALRYNTQLHRHELAVHDWDIANGEFIVDASTGRPQQRFAFYQTVDVERTSIQTRRGDDEVRADPGYLFRGISTESWGFDPGDLQQGAVIAGLEIDGGPGHDRLFGGPENDLIIGGPGLDFLVGGGGNDDLFGGPGDDVVAGKTVVGPDRLESTSRGTQQGRNDDPFFAAPLGSVGPGTIVDDLTLHFGDTGDWYIFETPTADRRFGAADGAFLSREMIEVKFERSEEDLRFHSPEFTATNVSLFAGEQTDPDEPLSILPVEQVLGVPKYYLLYVANVRTGARLNEPAPEMGRYSITFSADVDDTIDVPADGAETTLRSDDPADQPAVIPLGDIDGDGVGDFIAALQDSVGRRSDDLGGDNDGYPPTHPSDRIDSSFAHIYLSRSGAGDLVLDKTTPVLKLPAPVRYESLFLSQSTFAAPGDFNGDGLDDVAVAVTASDDRNGSPFVSEGVYLIFGQMSGWDGVIDVVHDADVTITGTTGRASVTNAGDANGDGIDDLLIGDEESIYVFDGRQDWSALGTASLLRADFQDNGEGADDEGFSFSPPPAGESRRWRVSARRGNDPGHSGPFSLYFGDEEVGHYDGDAITGHATSPPIDLTGVSGARLSFRYFLKTEPYLGAPPVDPGEVDLDRVRVLVSMTGPEGDYEPLPAATNRVMVSDGQEVWPGPLDDPTDAWREVNLSLGDYVGNVVHLRFEFASDDNSNPFEGWYVDDVRVTGPRLTVDDANVIYEFLSDGDTRASASHVSGIGDFDGDGRDDFAHFAIVASGNADRHGPRLHVYAGDQPAGGGPSVTLMLPSPFANDFENPMLRTSADLVQATGDVDGDGMHDLALGGPRQSYVIFGGIEAAPDELVPLADVRTLHVEGRFVPVGEIDGEAPADLGALVFESMTRLNEQGGSVSHQVAHVYLGENLPDSGAVGTPDLILEPARPDYDAGALRLHALGAISRGGIGDFDIALADPLNGATYLFTGRQIAPEREDDTSHSGSAAAEEPEPFKFELATPLAQSMEPRPVGIKLFPSDADLAISNAFVVNGSEAEEHLKAASSVGDVNDDGIDDLLVSGDLHSYILLGPVDIDSASDAENRANVVVDASELGWPAQRMGDIDGDGTHDLVFVQSTPKEDSEINTSFDVTISMIKGGPGIERDLTSSGVDGSIFRSISFDGNALFGTTPLEVHAHVLNFNGDGRDDVLLVLRAESKPQAYLFSGEELVNDRGLLAEPLLTIGRDPTFREDVQRDLFGPHPIGYAGDADTDLTAVVAGDVNGDGLDDILLLDSGFVADVHSPDLGRAYLLLGRPDGELTTFEIDLGDENTDLVLQDIDLGGSLAALGDLNRDGYDDFAIGQDTIEGGASRGSVLLFFGSDDVGADQPHTASARADVTIHRLDLDDLPGDFALSAPLALTAGDFDGDGQPDLAIGETHRILTIEDPQDSDERIVLDREERGSMYVFRSILQRGAELSFADADVTLEGSGQFDRLGMLSATPSLDLDGDRIDDLLIGAGGADVVRGDVTKAGGKVYVVYGERPARTAWPPEDTMPLVNRTIAGSGSFVVDDGSGKPFTHADVLPVDDSNTPQNEGELWFEFTTLGDGLPGDQLRLTPRPMQGKTFLLDAQFGTVAIETVQTPPLNVDLAANGSFETSEPITGPLPTNSGQWQGDLSTIVQPVVFSIVPPTDGRRMLQFQATSRTGPSRATVAEVFQLIDLSDHLEAVQSGEAVISAAASFNRVLGDARTDTEFGLSVFAYAGAPDDFPNAWQQQELAETIQTVLTDSNPSSWEQVRNDFVLPPETAFIAVRLHANENVSNEAGPFNDEFDGHFADAVTVRLQTPGQDSSQPVLLPDPFLSAGGDGQHAGILELDLAQFQDATSETEVIENAVLRLDYFDAFIPQTTADILVSVLVDEGDALPTVDDRTAVAAFEQLATFTPSADGAGLIELDLTDSVRAALGSGKTRITVRLEALSADVFLKVHPADLGGESQTGLEVTTAARHGVWADVFDAKGAPVATGQHLVDMRTFDAGTWFVRAYNPLAETQDTSLSFTLEVSAPPAGQFHPAFDRDELHGGDGDDLLMGNDHVDLIFGESGDDAFVAEPIEAVDRTADEFLGPPPESELSKLQPRSLDPVIDIPDVALRSALAQAVGIVQTTSRMNTLMLARPIHASDLAGLTQLHAGFRGIESLDGLEFATNLEYLSLDGNSFDDIAPLAGMSHLKGLSLDYVPVEDLSPLASLTSLQFLSFDAAEDPAVSGVAEMAPLSGLTGLRRLSLVRQNVTSQLFFGDTDGDNDVDFADFLTLSANFAKETDAAFADGDFNGNGRVDFADFLLLSANYGKRRS